jgi:hypothetical protein
LHQSVETFKDVNQVVERLQSTERSFTDCARRES